MNPRFNAIESPNTPIILAQSAVSLVVPADTTEDILAVIPVPANVLGPNGSLRISHLWQFTNNANNKTMRIRLGGIGGTIISQFIWTTQTPMVAVTTLANRGATNSQITGTNAGVANSGSTFVAASAVDTLLATVLVITGQKAVGGDAMNLESFVVELLSSL